MKIWLTKNNEIPIREQIITQVRVAIASGEVSAGDRLPSTRELARRFGVHPNTISAAYSELTASGEIENRKGSGVYVSPRGKAQDDLECLIKEFLANADALGFGRDEIVERLTGNKVRSRTFGLIEPNPDLSAILASEIRTATKGEVLEIALKEVSSLDESVQLVAMFDEEPKLAGKLSEKKCIFLKPNSVAGAMKGKLRPDESETILIVSAWGDFLTLARLFLLAAKIPAESIVTCSTHETDWQRRLKSASIIICDVVASAQIGHDDRVSVFTVISQSSIEELLA